jgi:hypothetical protein
VVARLDVDVRRATLDGGLEYLDHDAWGLGFDVRAT